MKDRKNTAVDYLLYVPGFILVATIILVETVVGAVTILRDEISEVLNHTSKETKT